MPYLIQDPESTKPVIHELKLGINSIGRESDNSIAVIDKSLSRHHAHIILEGRRVVVMDIGSLNKTYVNQIQVDQAELKDGDLVRFGMVTFKYTRQLEHISQSTLPHLQAGGDFSILSQFAPEQSQTHLQTLLRSDSQSHPGTALKLRQHDKTQRSVDQLKILLEVSKQLSTPQEPEALLTKILDLIFEIINLDRAAILLVNPETHQLEPRAIKAREGVIINEQFYSSTIVNFVREQGIGILSADAGTDQRFREAVSVVYQAIRASLCVPLKPRDVTIGVLYIDHLSSINIYTQEDLEFFTGLANQAAIAIDNSRLYTQIQQEAILRTKLERFFPPAVSRKLKEDHSLEIIDTEVTALFADITGFTQMSSKMQPRQIIEMLNEYFQVMVEEIVFKYEGTLEKYIGDALLAVWGAPYQHPDDADKAVQAAIEMQQTMARLNHQWRQQGKSAIQIHIGLNTGKVAAGNIGSKKLIQYATIGDTTNVTSRICSVAQADEILISQTTLAQLKNLTIPLEKLPPVMVKGKEHPLELYRICWN